MSDALTTARRAAEALGAVPAVRAVALGGSQVTGLADASSDADLYVVFEPPLDVGERHAALRSLADGPILRIAQWGDDDLWADRAFGVRMEAMYWAVDWAEEQLDRVLVRHEAQLGYTTAFWHTLRAARPLYDDGTFADLQARARAPYPHELQRAIVEFNYPTLRRLPPSYRQQLAKAVRRGDVVSRNHWAAAFLASYFDCLFAANAQPHPGEKRLLSHVERLCPHRPPDLARDVAEFLRAAADGHAVEAAADRLVDGLDPILERLHLLPA